MKVLTAIISMTMLSALGWSQSDIGNDVTSPPATSGSVTLAGLEGTVVTGTTTVQQVIRRGGNEFPVRLDTEIRIAFRPDQQIEVIMDLTSHTPRGVQKSRPQGFTATLGKPVQANWLGEGHAVWFFDNETLVNLRTYKGGAFKREIAFSEGTSGLTCTMRDAFARENGVGRVELKSAIDGAPIMIISGKQISSNCRMTKQK